VPADLSVQADVRRVAREVSDRYGHIDILVNNAGAAFSRREQSADGLELTWATNHLAPFQLTELLLPLLVAAPAGRIVNVVSEFYGRKFDLGNLQGERKYSYFGAYRASKLGEVLFTTELARRIKGSGVTVVSVSPGPAKTNCAMPSGVLGVVLGVMQRTPMFRPAGQAARGIAWAATAPDLAGKSGALHLRLWGSCGSCSGAPSGRCRSGRLRLSVARQLRSAVAAGTGRTRRACQRRQPGSLERNPLAHSFH
jgi:NAD(P)-dependent dehydrogenase (short-subunit alcohol dehydrogenase family)